MTTNCSTCRFADIAGHHEPCHTCMIAVERGRGFSMYEAHSSKVIPLQPAAPNSPMRGAA